MKNRYVRVRHGTNGKSILTSFEIPGVRLELLSIEGQPTEAFGVKDQCLDAIVTGAKKGIELEMQRVAMIPDREVRIKELEQALLCIDELLAKNELRYAKRHRKQGVH